jgi:hypothetical protein
MSVYKLDPAAAAIIVVPPKSLFSMTNVSLPSVLPMTRWTAAAGTPLAGTLVRENGALTGFDELLDAAKAPAPATLFAADPAIRSSPSPRTLD